MTERENLPAVIAAQALAVLSERRGSLVGRGLVALRKDNDALYRQARTEFDEESPIVSWNENRDATLFSAFKIFQQLANENYGKAYYPLSILYDGKQDIEEGQDRTQHFAQLAFDWCFVNRANQDVELWRDLGEMYAYGNGVEQNYEQAVNWYRKAAEQGDPKGQWDLGYIYLVGRGVEQNDEQAMYWRRKAADQGKTIWKNHLAIMYAHGAGVEQNYEQAVYWYRKAAEQGSRYAQEALKELGIDWNK